MFCAGDAKEGNRYSLKVCHAANAATGTFANLAHLIFSVYKLFFVDPPFIDEEIVTQSYEFWRLSSCQVGNVICSQMVKGS